MKGKAGWQQVDYSKLDSIVLYKDGAYVDTWYNHIEDNQTILDMIKEALDKGYDIKTKGEIK